MTKKKIAINGFGRIGRLTTRILLEKYAREVDLVGINDLTSVANLAYLFQYDTTYRQPDFSINTDGDALVLDGDKVPVYSSKDPSELPWAELEVDTVLECTGFFRTSEGAGQHLEAGAKQVVISAPGKSPEISTVVLGVNEPAAGGSIYSNASCTTNCIAPALKCLEDSFGITRGSGLTVHAYTSTQRLQDSPSDGDYRKARAAAANLIPTSTGAAKAVFQAIPSLEGKLTLSALRVPVITGSMVQLTLELHQKTTRQNILQALQEYAQEYPNILQVTHAPLVSSDIVMNSHSCIVDAELLTYENNLLTLVLWYDNEWGYSNRLADLVMSLSN